MKSLKIVQDNNMTDLKAELYKIIRELTADLGEDYQDGYTFTNGDKFPSIGEFRQHYVERLLKLFHQEIDKAVEKALEDALKVEDAY